jgi:F-type H+-transporting ATPase subunit epsilon
MARSFHIAILSPYETEFEGEVESVILPGVEGEFGVLPGHALFVSQLRPGIARWVQDGRPQRLCVGGGFGEVHPQGVTVFVDSAERIEELDGMRAEAARDRTRMKLAACDPADTRLRAHLELKLARAENRLRACQERDPRK